MSHPHVSGTKWKLCGGELGRMLLPQVQPGFQSCFAVSTNDHNRGNPNQEEFTQWQRILKFAKISLPLGDVNWFDVVLCVCQREREMLLLIDESIWQEKLSVLSEEKYRHFPRDKVSFKVGWYCGNWWLLTLILITTITRRSAQWRVWPEARRWTICGWSSLPTISLLEDGRAGA